ncbi:sigma-54-dependent Fis family transcriptional regulator [bacterium]|nr:sigma-54-dependent Fis family transcriptional regulator [bacterium]
MQSTPFKPGKNLAKQATQLRLLNELSTKMQSLLNADASENFYQEIVNIIQSHFDFYVIHICEVNQNHAAVLMAQVGAYRNKIQVGHVMIAEGEGIHAIVISTKKSYLSNDVRLDSHYSDLSIPVETRSELCVPILKNGNVIATLNVESVETDAFDEDDVITLEAVASQIAVALTNRRLYGEAKSFNKKLQQAVDEKTIELRQAHERILEQQRLLQKENKALKSLVDHDSRGLDLVGKSPAILSILTMVDKIAPTTATVLIQGESGTGKELIARRLHTRSERADKPYVTVNCGALQESLLESELFGHEKGSFTGAVNQKMGLCETADGGTIFLDEIGELSLGIQAKLLRFLQEGEFYRIGGKRPIKVDVRVISATNRDLELEVRESRFREDLFYRLNTITLRMPPLRKRKEDIPMLVDHFLKNSRFGGAAQQIRRVDSRVYDVLTEYDWPGNIRELQNTIERLKILAENNEIVLEDVPFGMRAPKLRTDLSDFSVEMPLDEIEKNHILRTLAYHHGNKTKTAQGLGITIKTLYNKLHRYGILQPSSASTGSATSASEETLATGAVSK